MNRTRDIIKVSGSSGAYTPLPTIGSFAEQSFRKIEPGICATPDDLKLCRAKLRKIEPGICATPDDLKLCRAKLQETRLGICMTPDNQKVLKLIKRFYEIR